MPAGAVVDGSAMSIATPQIAQSDQENDWDQKARDIVVHGVDAFVMGDDWQGRFDHLKPLCEVVYLPRTEGVSTSVLKQLVVGAAA